MKVIVHIGTEKTGTSSIQKYLYKNRRKLRSAGFHFLLSGGKENNRALAAYCRDDHRSDDYFRDNNIETAEQRAEFRRQIDATLSAELQSLPRHIHTVVLSSEHLSSRLFYPAEMERFRTLINRFFDEVQILCYIREQVRACESWYSTTLKGGGVNSLHEFMQRCRPPNYYFNYHDMLANWEEYFGRDAIEVGLFSRAEFVNGDLLDDFTARLDPSLVGKLSKRLPVENESLSPAGQALARAINVGFPILSAKPDVLKLRDRCKQVIYRRLKGGGQMLSQDRRLACYESFLDSNERVRQRYFPDLELLFPPPSEPRPNGELLNGDFERALTDILQMVLRHPAIGGSDYVDLFGAIATSVEDMFTGGHSKAARIRGKQIVLNDNDAHLLSVCAQRLETRNTYLAQRLMQLVVEINPELPGVQEKLKSYQDEQQQDSLELFLLTYVGGVLPTDPQELKVYQERGTRWLAALRPAAGPPATGVGLGVKVTAEQQTADQDTTMDAYSIIQAESLEEAVKIARDCPRVDYGAEIHVRPLEQFPMEYK